MFATLRTPGALGLKRAFLTNWLFGYGLRAIGTAEADILFTRYNLHMTEENISTPSSLVVNLYQRHPFISGPTRNIEFGFGWETYFDNHNYHSTLMATYGFQIFWNQNMFRNFVDDVSVGKSYVPNGDLYIHGVTGELRLDF